MDNGVGGFDCLGQCKPGATICVPPEIVCDGFVGPAPQDSCDALDNDCDDLIDEDANCPNGSLCVGGECVTQCAAGEFPCPFGSQCDTFPDNSCDTPPCRFCVPDPCVNKVCGANEVCDSSTGECRDLCEGVQCQDGQTCDRGFCVDCFVRGHECGNCEVCEAGMDGIGRCIADACCGVDCQSSEYCSGGNCIPAFCTPSCSNGTICVEGACVTDPCRDVNCPSNQLCNPTNGQCQGDLCDQVVCGTGLACDPGTGMCIPNPCLAIECPSNFECKVGFDGAAQCAAIEGEKVFSGGGGCSTSGTGANPWLFALGALLLARLRRRRRRQRE